MKRFWKKGALAAGVTLVALTLVVGGAFAAGNGAVKGIRQQLRDGSRTDPSVVRERDRAATRLEGQAGTPAADAASDGVGHQSAGATGQQAAAQAPPAEEAKLAREQQREQQQAQRQCQSQTCPRSRSGEACEEQVRERTRARDQSREQDRKQTRDRSRDGDCRTP